MFHQDMQTLRSGFKYEAQPSFFNPLRGVCLLASQTDNAEKTKE